MVVMAREPMRRADPAPQHPLVSVVVATNRVSPFLDEGLRSVAAQTYHPIEVIVVDDGSNDPAAIAEAASRHIDARLVRQEPLGVSTARNNGAALAAGEFLVFLDDDDRWHPERIERQVQALIQAPDAPLSYCGMQSIDADGLVIATADQVQVRGRRDVARRATGIILPNVMIRRDAFDSAGGFDPALRLAEDLDLVLALSAQGPFVFSDQTLVDYRTHALNTTGQHRELCLSIDQVLRAHQSTAAEHNDPELVSAYRQGLRANGRYAWWSARRAAQLKRPISALGEMLWALSFAPWAPVDALLRRLRGLGGEQGAQQRRSTRP